MVNTKQCFENEKSNYTIFYGDIKAFNLQAQQIFSFCLTIFLLIYGMVVRYIGLLFNGIITPSFYLHLFHAFISFLIFLLFRYYFPRHEKYIVFVAHLNVIITILIMDIQYSLYSSVNSYTVTMSVILCTSVIVLGRFWHYLMIVTITFLADVTVFIISADRGYSTEMKIFYLTDIVLFILLMSALHLYFTSIQYRNFKQKRALKSLSERDSLTNLYNRKYIENVVNSYYGENESCAMILIDIDDFKKINDIFGHIKGDEILIETAENIAQEFRHTDCVARVGGDEFMIFIPNIICREKVLQKAERLSENFLYIKGEDDTLYTVSYSVGIAFEEKDGTGIFEELYKKADTAMYKAKTKKGVKGSNITVFER